MRSFTKTSCSALSCSSSFFAGCAELSIFWKPFSLISSSPISPVVSHESCSSATSFLRSSLSTPSASIVSWILPSNSTTGSASSCKPSSFTIRESWNFCEQSTGTCDRDTAHFILISTATSGGSAFSCLLSFCPLDSRERPFVFSNTLGSSMVSFVSLILAGSILFSLSFSDTMFWSNLCNNPFSREISASLLFTLSNVSFNLFSSSTVSFCSLLTFSFSSLLLFESVALFSRLLFSSFFIAAILASICARLSAAVAWVCSSTSLSSISSL